MLTFEETSVPEHFSYFQIFNRNSGKLFILSLSNLMKLPMKAIKFNNYLSKTNSGDTSEISLPLFECSSTLNVDCILT